jgi:cytosine/adenosine deaminase-related metal-dependent hydrolase
MNNAVGAMAFDEMIRRDARLCLGNDGFSNNMWEDWKAAYLLHKVVHRDPRRANGASLARVAAEHNTALAEVFFPEVRLGQIAEGARADLIFVDYHPFTPLSGGNLPWHILFGFEASMVTTTIVDGAVLMRDRALLTLDEAEIAAEALALAPKVWSAYTAHAEAAQKQASGR